MKITITGTPGSGKSTLGKDLAKHLNYKFFSGGDMRRRMAQDHQMTLAEFNELGEKEDWTDKELDAYIAKYGRENDDFVVEARLGWHFIPDSVKVFLDADEKERARRMLPRNLPEENFQNLKDVISGNKKRVKSDVKRYKKYYKLDPYDKKHYDIVIDSTGKKPSEVLNEIIEALPQSLKE
ncbi:(d)CMP kinase [Nanoarchaeota archaeon]